GMLVANNFSSGTIEAAEKSPYNIILATNEDDVLEKLDQYFSAHPHDSSPQVDMLLDLLMNHIQHLEFRLETTRQDLALEEQKRKAFDLQQERRLSYIYYML
ncbi:3112_t:CDS:1, partial [Paraglomus brasilianum]